MQIEVLLDETNSFFIPNVVTQETQNSFHLKVRHTRVGLTKFPVQPPTMYV